MNKTTPHHSDNPDLIQPERVFGSPRASDADEVRISFDWEIPRQAGDPLTFLVHINRWGRESSIRFQIDLGQLQTSELQKLHDFLGRRHAGLDNASELTSATVWLLTVSLRQQQPSWSDEDRAIQVRQLLLATSNRYFQ